MEPIKKTVKARSKKMSVAIPAKEELEYEKDFSKWAKNQAKFLRNREFTKLDMGNLVEEIEDLSKRERDKLASHLENLLMHKLKVKFQPGKHAKSWDLSIKAADHKVQKVLKENPSLKPKLKDIVKDAFFSARLKAALETKLEEDTFPEECPWSLKELFSDLEKKYL